MGNNTLERKPSQIKVARLLAELKNRDMTRAEVEALLIVSYNSSARYLRVLHEAGTIFIRKWNRTGVGGPPKAVYALGPGRDAKRPAPEPRSLALKRWYRKLRSERPADYEALRARAVHRRRVKRGQEVKPDPLTAWIPRRAANDQQREAA